MSCAHCTNPNGDCRYPYYGVAPHTCFYKIDGALVGQSKELPESEWPDNFVIDSDAGAPAGYPRCGVYTHCPICEAGK